ncbi:MAG: 2-hydroxyacyl-CoA dehydratase family protein [Lachnospiraceae bacterium]|nr:2-hydroxyacyl-CoA dehydratase family protein [Lachnospiraceae bacterium]
MKSKFAGCAERSEIIVRTDMESRVNLSAYKKELKDVLQRLVETMPAYKELRFFIKCVINHYLTDLKKNNSGIVVVGSNIPEELVLVSGKMPYWILGGSRVSSMWADDIVPRDTDPVSRSGLGYIRSGFAEKSLILIPLVSDSTRKLAYILKSGGFKIHTFHFPPVKDDQMLLEWRRQYEACRDAVSLHLKRPLTKRVLQKSQEQIFAAKRQMQDFMEVSQDTLDGTSRMFILGSYYCADNLSEWSVQLKCLTDRLRKEHKRRNNKKSKVLLLGSPVYFPNYKVPFLIEDAGLELFLQADYTTLSMQGCIGLERLQKENMADGSRCKEGCECAGAHLFYRNDTSPAYVKNNSMYERVEKLLAKKEIDGVVYHVLKGQIEYDFELGRFEELFEKLDIPVFRLETDYNYQDIEQLRIRLEAFSEILNQRRLWKGYS